MLDDKPFRQRSEGPWELFPFVYEKPFRLSPQPQDPSGVTSAASLLLGRFSTPLSRSCQRLALWWEWSRAAFMSGQLTGICERGEVGRRRCGSVEKCPQSMLVSKKCHKKSFQPGTPWKMKSRLMVRRLKSVTLWFGKACDRLQGPLNLFFGKLIRSELS
jgi:hypothetical protein